MEDILQILNSFRSELETIKSLIDKITKPVPCHLAGAWLDGQEVMQLLHISKRSLQKLRSNGTLSFSRIDGKFYYKVADIELLLNNNYRNSITPRKFNHLNKSNL